MNNIHKYLAAMCLMLALLFPVLNLKAQDDKKDDKKKEEVKVTDAVLQLSFDTADGAKQIKATVKGKDASGTLVPVKGVTIKLFIKKSFGNLPVEGDNMATDDDGVVTVEFPKQMPGDKKGNVTLLAKVEDEPKTGDLEATAVSGFGIPSQPKSMLNERSLFAASSNAPIPLVITVNLLIVIVWGTIFYILFKLLTINKLGKNENTI